MKDKYGYVIPLLVVGFLFMVIGIYPIAIFAASMCVIEPIYDFFVGIKENNEHVEVLRYYAKKNTPFLLMANTPFDNDLIRQKRKIIDLLDESGNTILDREKDIIVVYYNGMVKKGDKDINTAKLSETNYLLLAIEAYHDRIIENQERWTKHSKARHQAPEVIYGDTSEKDWEYVKKN